MTRHGRACGRHLRLKSELESAVAKSCVTHSTNYLTLGRPRSSNRTTWCPVHSNGKGKQGSLRKAAIRNIIPYHPSPNLRKTLPVSPIIATIPAPVNQNRASPISPVEAAMPASHQRHGFQTKSTKAEMQTGNAPSVAAQITKPTFVPNLASRTHLTRTPVITALMKANKLSAKSHSTCSSSKTSLHLSICNSTEEAGQYGVRIGEFEKLSGVSHLGQDTTTLNRVHFKSHFGRSGPDVKPIPMQHKETRCGTYLPWSPCMEDTRQHAVCQITNRLRCNKDFYITQPTVTGVLISRARCGYFVHT